MSLELTFHGARSVSGFCARLKTERATAAREARDARAIGHGGAGG